MSESVILLQSQFGRWVIGRVIDKNLWSGRRWVEPFGGVQVCNFATREEAQAYAEKNGFTISAP